MKKYVINIALCLCLVIACILAFSACDGEDAVTYTVTFEENGGSRVEDITGIEAGGVITLPEDPTKEGFVFDGWYFDNNTFKEKFDESHKIEQDTILFAKWSVLVGYGDPIEVSFFADDVQVGQTITVIYGTGLEEGQIPTVPSKTGYKGAWNVTDFSCLTENLRVDAVYAPRKYNITFDYSGIAVDNKIESKQVSYNQKVGALPSPTSPDCEFLGWYYGEVIFTGETVYTFTQDITLVAKWRATGICPSCGAPGDAHPVCPFCQIRTCVGDHSECTTTASPLDTTTPGLYLLYGEYDSYSGAGSISVRYQWLFKLTINEDNTFLFQYCQRANESHPFYILINFYGTVEQGAKTTIMPKEAYVTSDLNGTDGDPYDFDKTATATVTLYDDGTFAGDLNDIRGICSGCGDSKSKGYHGICLVCLKYICVGDHKHGGEICDQCGQSNVIGNHTICDACHEYKCNGEDHETLDACGLHYLCEEGDHGQCPYCQDYKCNGKAHDLCQGCRQVICTAEGHHGECEYEGCDGYLCDGEDHFHGGFNCFDHVPSEDDGDCTTPVSCSLCGREAIAAKEHYADALVHDESYHWGVCQNNGCTKTFGKENHNADGVKCLNSLKCDSCEYVIPRADHSYSSSVCKYCGSDAITTRYESGKYVNYLKPEHTYKGWVYISGNMGQLYAPEITELYIGPAFSFNCEFYMPSLQNIYVDESNPNYKSIDGVLCNKEGYIIQIPAGREGIFSIPDEVVGFMGSTYNGTKLTGINAPSQERWEGLTFAVGGGVTTGTPNPLYSVHNLYFNNRPVTHVKITNTYVTAYCYAGCNATFELCEGLRTINACSFAGCPGFTSFIAPSTLETIKHYAFEGCENILEVDLSPATNLRTVYMGAFKDCTGLKTAKLSSSITVIGAEAFSNTAIKELVIFEGATELFEALSGMDSLESLEIPLSYFYNHSITNYYQYKASFGSLFGKGKSELGSIEQHYYYFSGSTTIKESLTYRIPLSFKRVKLTGECDTIPGLMFENCSYLEEVIVPASVTTIGSSAFTGTTCKAFFESSTFLNAYKAAKYYYYYQEQCPSDPVTKGRTWRYVDGKPTIWTE